MVLVAGLVIPLKRLILIVANITVMIIAFTMLLIGIILAAKPNEFESMPSQFIESLKESAGLFGVHLDTANISFRQFVEPFAYTLIGIGLAAAVFSMLGVLGVCFSIRFFLWIYLGISSAKLVIEIIFVIFLYADPSTLAAVIKPYVEETMDSYAGIEGTNVDSLVWNAMMNYKNCCGINDYTDFENLENWPAPINGKIYDLKTPVICCKEKTTNFSCAVNPTDDNSFWKKGCQEKLVEPFTSDNPIPFTTILLFFICQAALIYCVAWVLMC